MPLNQSDKLSVIAQLAQIITQRKRENADKNTSYTASLFAKGKYHCAQKFGEEAFETVIAALEENPKNLPSEAADLIYHLLVLLEETHISLDVVLDKLAERQGIGGLEEKKQRKKNINK